MTTSTINISEIPTPQLDQTQREGFLDIARLADDGHVRLNGQTHSQAPAYLGLSVNYQDSVHSQIPFRAGATMVLILRTLIL